MKEVTLNVTLTLSGPIITGATTAGGFGLDLPFARYAGHCYLPGTHVKGRLREALKTLQPYLKDFSEKDIYDWLGPEIPENNFNLPERGRILFDDFVAEQPGTDDIRTRITMDSIRGAVKKGCYLAIEAPFKPGEQVNFHGTIRFLCENEDQPKMAKNIETGLRWIPALGGQRSVGFGRLIEVAIDAWSRAVPTTVPILDSCDALSLRLYIKQPFCIAKPRIDENLFEADRIIPGGVLKGCLANTLNQILGRPLGRPMDGSLPPPWKELGAAFDKIRFDHAFPASEEQCVRPQHYPLSIVRTGGNTYDVALCLGPGMINNLAPAFSIDWKEADYKAVEDELCGPPFPPTILRVRTAMDWNTRRPREAKLFAYEMIDPQYFVWHSRVDITKMPENNRAAVRSQLEALFDFDLKYLGKTKADVEVKAIDAPSITVPNLTEDGFWVVTLQTPALMVKPDVSFNEALVDETILPKKYSRFWEEISQNTLELVRFFAQQRLLGGYLHYRFQRSKPYNPFLVTTEQSVFVMKPRPGKQDEAKEFLLTCRCQGIPLPEWAKVEYGDSWETCPFVPENGFGEIAINMDCHTSKKPGADDFQEV